MSKKMNALKNALADVLDEFSATLEVRQYCGDDQIIAILLGSNEDEFELMGLDITAESLRSNQY